MVANVHWRDHVDTIAMTAALAATLAADPLARDDLAQATPSAQYRAACHGHGITPSKYVLSKLGSIDSDPLAAMSFDCSSTMLGKRGAIALADVLLRLANLASLNLSGTGMGDEGCSVVCRALSVHPSIARVDLSNNLITAAATPALRMFCRSTGASVVLKGNTAFFESSMAALAQCSLEAARRKAASLPAIDDPSPLKRALRSPPRTAFDAEKRIVARRLAQLGAFAQMRTLRRVPATRDGWLVFGVHVSCPFRTFLSEFELITETIVPRVNRALRKNRVHIVVTGWHEPRKVDTRHGSVSLKGDVDRFRDEEIACASAALRRSLVTQACDAMVVLRSGKRIEDAHCNDWRAKDAMGRGAIPVLDYVRAAVHGLPEAFRDTIETQKAPGPIAESRSTVLREMQETNQAFRLTYTAEFVGLTHRGVPIATPDTSFASTLQADLFALGQQLRSRQAPATRVFATLSDQALAALDLPPLVHPVTDALASCTKPVVALVGEPGSGKTAQLRHLEAHLRQAIETCVVVRHSMLAGNRTLDGALCALLDGLGVPHALEDYCDTPDALLSAFLRDLRRFRPPPSSTVVTLIVDDGDCVASGPGVAALSNIDQSALCIGSVPVRIVFSTTDSGPKPDKRLFVERVTMPKLTEEEAIDVLLWELRKSLVGPQTEAAARKAGVHLTVHKPHACRPLYMALAAAELTLATEDVSMLSIADALPPTLAELVTHTTARDVAPRLATVLDLVLATADDPVPGSAFLPLLSRLRAPADPRGGPVAEEHGRGKWRRLVDHRSAPLASLDLIGIQQACPALFSARTPGSLLRQPIALGSRTAFDVLEARRHDERGFETAATVDAALCRWAYIEGHGLTAVALARLPRGALTRLMSPAALWAFVAHRAVRELRRLWHREQQLTSVDPRLRAYRVALQRHWAAIVAHPNNIFTALRDVSDDGDGRHDCDDSPPDPVGDDVRRARSDHPAAHMALAGRVTVVSGAQHSPSAGDNANPIRITALADLFLVYLGIDERELNTQAAAARNAAQSLLRHTWLEQGVLAACAPPTFLEAERTQAQVRIGDAPIVAVTTISSEDLSRTRVACMSWRSSCVVVVACWWNDGALALTKVAQACDPAFSGTVHCAIALSGAKAVAALSGDASEVGSWCPSVAAAAGSIVHVWPEEPHGGDNLINGTSARPPTQFSGHSGTVQHLAFSPGGAKICGVDNSGTVIVWGSLESPCPGLMLATSVVGGAVSRIEFASNHEVLFVSPYDVTSWSCKDSTVRKVISTPTSSPFNAAYCVSWRPLVSAGPTSTSESDDVDKISEDESLPPARPLMTFVFADVERGVAVRYDERLPLEFERSEERRLGSDDAPLPQGAQVVTSVAGCLAVDRTYNELRVLAPTAPQLATYFVAAGPADDVPECPGSRDPTRAVHARVLDAAVCGDGPALCVAFSTRRRVRRGDGTHFESVGVAFLRAVDGPLQASVSGLVNGP